MIISVIGAHEPSAEIALLAEQVGEALARRGATLVCGGLGGVMEAVCRGAKSAGGTTVGILPGGDPTAANPWVDIPICTGIRSARNVIVVRSGRAVIAVGGSFGTLSEIGHALNVGIPVVGLRTWGLLRDGNTDTSVIMASDAQDAVNKVMEAASRYPATSSKDREG